MKLMRRLTELIYPSRARCLGCGDLSGIERDWLCDACLRRLKPGVHRVHSEYWGEDGISKGYFALYYERPVSGLVHALKYESVYRCAAYLVELMEPVLCALENQHYDCLVPVPLHYERQWTRSFNQAEVLARLIAPRLNCSVDTSLMRRVNTRRQARLGIKERRDNVKGAFFTGASFEGRRVLLIDDVLTTGSTACSCAQTLRQAGAADVDALTVAGSRIYRRRRKNFPIILRK